MTRRRKRIAYLAGAIDAVVDRGLGWRKTFAVALAEIGVGVVILNDMEEKELSPAQVMALKAKDDLTEFKRTFRKHILRPDLAAMDACDMVVVRWDGEAIAGTAHECGRAFMRGQPVLLVTPRPFVGVPHWLLACCDKEFHTIDELVEYLRTRKTRKVKGAGE
jgi:nucleoside 2-deoxyribosyltransferase